jgi:hypothetical protein
MSKTIGMALSKVAGSVALKVVIVATAAIGGTALVSSSVFAALTASATNTTGGSVTTGTLKLTQLPSAVTGITGGFVTAITAMAPGDTINRYVDLTNGGTLDAITPTLGVSGTGSTLLTTDGTKGLQVVVNNCSVAWTSAGVCGGTTTAVMTTKSALTMATAQALTLTNTAGFVSFLQVSISLPNGTENVLNGALPVGTIQGLNTTLTWTFSETQRTGTTTNS